MIQSFRDEQTYDLFINRKSRKWSSTWVTALRKLDQLEAALTLNDLRNPPGNRLEALKADRTGQHSIRVNDKWRICFVWEKEGPSNVEMVDYH